VELLSVMILAGGWSSRMGQDKATISIDGIPLIRRIYDVAAACSDNARVLEDRVYVVTPWVDRYQPILPITCQFLLEQQPHQGPLVGFAQSLHQITSAWVLLLACDLPNLSTPVVQAWIDGLGDIPHQSIAYLPKNPDGKGWEPLCGFYRRSGLDSLLEYIQTGGRSFQGWLANRIVTELAVSDRQWLLNCNTPADLAGAIANISLKYPDSKDPNGIK
jgi:molybdenum cofactor guanylyltransferase